jgi:putative aldouronate transport system substrate-binding protein
MFLGNNSPGWFNGTFTKMLDSKMITTADQIAPMIVTSPKDGKGFWLTQTEDYWSVTNFSHKVDDAKMGRILDMWDWLLSEDGRKFRVAGIPDTDYTNNADGTMTIKWPKNADGSYKSPYVDQAFNEFTPPGLIKAPTETDRKEGFDAFKNIDKFMQTSADYHVHPLNWDLNTFGGEQFAKYGSFSSDTTAKIKEVMAAKDDVATMWAAFLKEIMPKFQPVMDELDKGLK